MGFTGHRNLGHHGLEVTRLEFTCDMGDSISNSFLKAHTSDTKNHQEQRHFLKRGTLKRQNKDSERKKERKTEREKERKESPVLVTSQKNRNCDAPLA